MSRENVTMTDPASVADRTFDDPHIGPVRFRLLSLGEIRESEGEAEAIDVGQYRKEDRVLAMSAAETIRQAAFNWAVLCRALLDDKQRCRLTGGNDSYTPTLEDGAAMSRLSTVILAASREAF